MKMMCIKGRQHPAHTGLVSGQIYEVNPHPSSCDVCPYKPVAADGSVFTRPVRIKCFICGKVLPAKQQNVPWNPNRFVPWDDPKVSLEEANDLYAPTKLVEEFL